MRKAIAANPLFVIALLGLGLLTAGIALKLDPPTAAIFDGGLLLAGAIWGVRLSIRSSARGR